MLEESGVLPDGFEQAITDVANAEDLARRHSLSLLDPVNSMRLVDRLVVSYDHAAQLLDDANRSARMRATEVENRLEANRRALQQLEVEHRWVSHPRRRQLERTIGELLFDLEDLWDLSEDTDISLLFIGSRLKKHARKLRRLPRDTRADALIAVADEIERLGSRVMLRESLDDPSHRDQIAWLTSVVAEACERLGIARVPTDQRFDRSHPERAGRTEARPDMLAQVIARRRGRTSRRTEWAQ